MAGLIERNSKTDITLHTRTGISDGKATYKTTSCKGMVFDFSLSDMEYYGKIGTQKTVLLSPVDEKVSATSRLTINGEDFDIVSVKTLRNLKGALLGYKVVI